MERARKQKPNDDAQTVYCYRYGVRLDGPDGHGKGMFVPRIGALYVRRHSQPQNRDQPRHVHQVQASRSKVASQGAGKYHQLFAGQVFGTLRLPPSIAFSSCAGDVEGDGKHSALGRALTWQVVDEDSPAVSAAEYSCVRLKAPAEWLTFPASCLDTLRRFGQQREVIDLLRAVGLGALVTRKAVAGEVADTEDEVPLLQRMHVKSFEAGHVLLREGAGAAHVYIVMDGECRELLETGHRDSRECDNRSVAGSSGSVSSPALASASASGSSPVLAPVPIPATETVAGTTHRQAATRNTQRNSRPHTAPRLRAVDGATRGVATKSSIAKHTACAENAGSEPQFVLPSGYVGQKSPRQQLLSLGAHAIFGDVAPSTAWPTPGTENISPKSRT